MPKKETPPETTVDEDEPKTVTSSADPPAQPEPTENWEDRFKGLQRTFDKRQKDFSTLQEKYDNLLETAESTKQAERERQAQLDALQKDLEAAKEGLDKATGELAAQEAKGKRMQLIMSEFPDLAKFEAAGLLPNADTDEEMTEKLTAFRDALNSTVKANVERQVVGASPAPSGTTATAPVRTAADIYSRLQQLAGARNDEDREEYDRLIAEWDKLQNAK
jgi:Skp family chaperone for outer membrane proteins